MAKQKNPLRIIGMTTDGRQVMGGLFRMADTHGFPLADSIQQCMLLGFCPGLWDWFQDALAAGWPQDRAVKRLREATTDAEFFVPDKMFRFLEQWRPDSTARPSSNSADI